MAAPAVLLHVDMPSDLVEAAVKRASEALAAPVRVEKDVAQHVKKGMEALNGGMWHVVVGASFGMSVSNAHHRLVLFKLGGVHFLVFQSFEEASLVRKDAAPTHVHRAQEHKKREDEEEDA